MNFIPCYNYSTNHLVQRSAIGGPRRENNKTARNILLVFLLIIEIWNIDV